MISARWILLNESQVFFATTGAILPHRVVFICCTHIRQLTKTEASPCCSGFVPRVLRPFCHPRFLASLTKSIDKLTSDSADFEQLEHLFEPILHNILLIWRYSKFYTTPTRLAVPQILSVSEVVHKYCRFPLLYLHVSECLQYLLYAFIQRSAATRGSDPGDLQFHHSASCPVHQRG